MGRISRTQNAQHLNVGEEREADRAVKSEVDGARVRSRDGDATGESPVGAPTGKRWIEKPIVDCDLAIRGCRSKVSG